MQIAAVAWNRFRDLPIFLPGRRHLLLLRFCLLLAITAVMLTAPVRPGGAGLGWLVVLAFLVSIPALHFLPVTRFGHSLRQPRRMCPLKRSQPGTMQRSDPMPGEPSRHKPSCGWQSSSDLPKRFGNAIRPSATSSGMAQQSCFVIMPFLRATPSSACPACPPHPCLTSRAYSRTLHLRVGR